MTPKKAAIASAFILTIILTAFQLLTGMMEPPEDKSFISLRVDWSEDEITNRLIGAGFEKENVVFLPVTVVRHPVYVFFNTLGSIVLLLLAHGWLKNKIGKKANQPPSNTSKKAPKEQKRTNEMFPDAEF